MTNRPIIFSAPMIQALLAGRKTQTRRMIKPQPVWMASCGDRDGFWSGDAFIRVSRRFAVGDRLWVREACWTEWRGEKEGKGVQYKAGGWLPIADTQQAEEAWYDLDRYAHNRHPDNDTNTGQLVPSIHMPRWASRLTLTVTDVRVQRAQEITDGDAEAEGVEWESADPPFYYVPNVWPHSITAVETRDGAAACYAKLWNHLHGPGAWDANPWIVALTFTVARGNIDA